MKALFLTLAFASLSFSSIAHTEEHDYSNEVRDEILSYFNISDAGNFEHNFVGKTAFGRDCTVRIDQSMYSSDMASDSINLFSVTVESEKHSGAIFNMNSGLYVRNKKDQSFAQNLVIHTKDESSLTIKKSIKRCSGGYLTQSCENDTDYLKLSKTKTGKLKVEIEQSVEGLKGLWSSEKSKCTAEI